MSGSISILSRTLSKLVPDSLKLASLNLLRNGRRSALSVLIIAIAVFALTSAGGFGLYTYKSLQEMAARGSGHLTLSVPGYFEQDEEMPLSNGLNENQALTQTLLQDHRVRGVQPRIYFTGLVSNGSKSTIFIGTGVNQDEFDMKGPFLDLQSGNTLMDVNSQRYDPSQPQVMLAKDLAKNLKVTVGDWVTLLATTSEGALNAFDFKVRGIYGTGVPELDKRALYVHIAEAKALLVTEKVSTLSVFLFELEETAVVQADLSQAIANQAQQVAITPWQERAFFYKKVKALYDRIFGIMGAVMAMVVFVSLFNTMTMSVTERTREIGTLSALGSYPREIIHGFMTESGLLALVGSLLGAALTALVSLLLMVVEIQMPAAPGTTKGYPLYVYFSSELVVYTAIGILAICLFTAFIAAQRGVNKPITEALAYV